jgi:hypothetical protein
MKKRLKELADVARQYAIDQYGNNLHHDGVQGLFSAEVFQQKFAELIVLECVELTIDYKNTDHYNGWLDYRDEIKKYFGVKQ